MDDVDKQMRGIRNECGDTPVKRKSVKPLLGAVEAGGTKFICAVGTRDGRILSETRILTTSPDETLGHALTYFRQQIQSLGPLTSIGIASFGPLDPHRESTTYGQILATPKSGWAFTDIVGPFRSAFDVPIGFDTDVNGSALGEWRWGAAVGLETFIYLTIGTGIGGGGLVDGKLLHGLQHPEMGHIAIPQDKERDPFEGVCPFHKDCFEGLASGPAIEKRWGTQAQNLDPGHPAWDLEAQYIALALRTYICMLSPERIILGGGVMQQNHLFPRIRRKTLTALNGYIHSPHILDGMDEFIVAPDLGGKSGLMGALVLADGAAGKEEEISGR
jgi:fructokinase